MCAIKPEHEMHFKLSVYTAQKISRAEFEQAVLERVLEAEVKLNEACTLRWHVNDFPNAKNHKPRGPLTNSGRLPERCCNNMENTKQ